MRADRAAFVRRGRSCGGDSTERRTGAWTTDASRSTISDRLDTDNRVPAPGTQDAGGTWDRPGLTDRPPWATIRWHDGCRDYLGPKTGKRVRPDYARSYRILWERHWWWRSREAFLLGWIRRLHRRSPLRRILDAGCGD